MAEPSKGRRLAASICLALLSWCWIGALQPAAAQIDAGVSAEIHNELRQIGKTLRVERMSPAELSAALDRVMALRSRAGQCRQTADAALSQSQQAEAALGKPQDHENAELAKTRQSIEAYMGKAANSLAECRLDLVIADMLASRIDESQKTELARHLTESGENLLALAQ